MEQKFKRGNLVKVLVGQQVWASTERLKDISSDYVGKTAVIEYSYAEKYGGDNTNSYSIMFTDTGSTLAWKNDNELEFIDEGGEHLFADCLAKKEVISKANTNLKQIIENWELKKGELSYETVLFLFEKIGFKSSFLTNGEFYALTLDWLKAYPLFNLIMTAKNEQDVISILKENIHDDLKNKILYFFNEIQVLKTKK